MGIHKLTFSHKTRIAGCAAILCAVLAVGGCGSSSQSSSGAASVSSETTQEPLSGAELLMNSTLLLPGDSAAIRFRTDEKIYFAANGLNYDSSDENVASVSYERDAEAFVVTAKSPGKAQITGTLDGAGGSLEVTVSEVDASSGLTLTTAEPAIELESGGKASVSLVLEGQVPDHYSAKYYFSPTLLLGIDGGWEGQTLNLTLSDTFSPGNGDLTVLVTDEEASSVLAAARINITVNG